MASRWSVWTSLLHQHGRCLPLLSTQRWSNIALLPLTGRKAPVHPPACLSSRSLVTGHAHWQALLPGNLVRCPSPDIDLPDPMPVHQLVFDRCDLFHDQPALTDVATGKTYTFGQLKAKAMSVASGLNRRGFVKGDVILAFSTNQSDFSVLMLACSCLGLVFTGANPAYTPVELGRQMAHSGVKAVFTLPELAPVVLEAMTMSGVSPRLQEEKFLFEDAQLPGWSHFQDLLEDDGAGSQGLPHVTFDPVDDVYALPYSSGTTGLPKGVMLTHYNVVTNLLQSEQYNGIRSGDQVLGLLPLYHGYAQLVTQFGSFYAGGHIHNLSKFEPETFLQCLQNKKITYANLVPPLILFLSQHPAVATFDLSNLRHVTSAAAPLGPELTAKFLDRFPHVTLAQGYGLTEASPAICLDRGESLNGSVGPVLPNTLLKVINVDTGEALGPNQEGEVCASGPQLMKGYLDNEQATNEMIRDGWMYTGDIGYYDEQGLLYISDRLKELIKVKGYQVAPAELEGILLGHPDIADACVLGIPDDKAGEIPKAFVVKQATSDITEDCVVKYVEGQVSDVKRLRGGVEFIAEIPKNPSGKILRRLLKQ